MPCSFIYGWESDYWAMTQDGETREYEIKTSRSDYLKDKLKDKHQRTEEGANYFYYVCPTDLIKKEEVDKKYGLIYVSEYGAVEVVKRPLKLHPNLYNDWYKMAIRMYWKWYRLWREKLNLKQITREEYFDILKNFNHE